LAQELGCSKDATFDKSRKRLLNNLKDDKNENIACHKLQCHLGQSEDKMIKGVYRWLHVFAIFDLTSFLAFVGVCISDSSALSLIFRASDAFLVFCSGNSF